MLATEGKDNGPSRKVKKNHRQYSPEHTRLQSALLSTFIWIGECARIGPIKMVCFPECILSPQALQHVAALWMCFITFYHSRVGS